MKLALLKGNRFNPWHLRVFNEIANVEATAFRAESEIQERFAARDDGSVPMPVEPIHFDTQKGNPVTRATKKLGERYASRAPRVLPFYDRLEGFDLIQSWELFTDWTAQALEAKRHFGIPVILMIWDNIPFNQEQDADRAETKRRAIAEADLFLVHTERSRAMLRLEGVDDARIRSVPPGVDVYLFRPSDAQSATRETFELLFVGWLLPRKGIDFLLMALRSLNDDRAAEQPAVRLHIVGSGPGRDRVDTLVERLGLGECVRFSEAVPYGAMPEVYRSADAFVLPSIATDTWQEQFGMSLIEAMACGVPAIAARSGAIPEVLSDTGILVQPNDFLSVRHAIEALISDPALHDSLRVQARNRAEQTYSLRAAADALADVYREVTRP